MRIVLVLLLLTSALSAADTNCLTAADVAKVLEPFRNAREARLPEGFCVRIDLEGFTCMHQSSVNETYVLTTNDVRLLREAYDMEAKTNVTVVERTRDAKCADVVCRILLALDYPQLIAAYCKTSCPALSEKNYEESMFPHTGAGLAASGECAVTVEFGGRKVVCSANCNGWNGLSSVETVRFAAVYYTLRHLARSKLGLAENDWTVDASKPAVEGKGDGKAPPQLLEVTAPKVAKPQQ